MLLIPRIVSRALPSLYVKSYTQSFHTTRTFTAMDKASNNKDSSSNGKITDWADKSSGAFNRQSSTFRNFISTDSGAEFPPEKGRYHLYVSYACPWAHRALIVRKLKGLESIIDVTAVHWHMGEKGWRFVTPDEINSDEVAAEFVRPDPLHKGFTHLREIYFEQNPEYEGRFTVPTLYDTKTRKIVNNESAEIIRMFYRAFDGIVAEEYKNIDLLPKDLEKQIDETNEWTYNDINNGVYKSGFATKTDAYEKAVTTLFKSLDRAEKHLQEHAKPYFWGDKITETDVRLYTTIVRFDPVYQQHFKCNIRDIRGGYPALHKWVRKLYWDIPAFHDTTNFQHIKYHYTRSHSQINPHAITPLGPLPHILPKDEEVTAVKYAQGKM